jgi:hypothetical protein
MGFFGASTETLQLVCVGISLFSTCMMMWGLSENPGNVSLANLESQSKTQNLETT